MNSKKRWSDLLLTVLKDIFCIGVILCTFSLFHHVLPAALAEREAARRSQETAAPTVTPIPLTTPAPVEATPTPEEIPAGPQRQFPFEGVFSEEVIVTENSYTSPNISLTITTHDEDLGSGPVRWYVCDVYIADIRNLSTVLAYDMYKYYYNEPILDMMTRKNAIFAISGDSCLRQVKALVVRNGYAYNELPTAADVCVMYMDGSMAVYPSDTLDVGALLAGEGDKEVYQTWHFGPSLLDEEGQPRGEYGVGFDQYVLMDALNPRAGIGYYEPGHYCMIVADGRGASVGATMDQFASLFAREGCTLAYNLDGGRVAQIAFNGAKYNVPSNGGNERQNDIICLVDFDAAAMDEEGVEP